MKDTIPATPAAQSGAISEMEYAALKRESWRQIDARSLDDAGYAAAKRAAIESVRRAQRQADDARELARVSAGPVGRPTCRTN